MFRQFDWEETDSKINGRWLNPLRFDIVLIGGKYTEASLRPGFGRRYRRSEDQSGQDEMDAQRSSRR